MTNYEVIKTPHDLRRAIDTLSNQSALGLDTETTDLDPYTSRLRLIQLAAPDKVFIIDLDAFRNGSLSESETLAPLRRLLEAPRPIKIAHNAKFDAKFIKHNLSIDLGGLFDTLLASQLVGAGDIEERHGLESVATRYLNESVDKTERLSNWDFELSESQLAYAARDAAVLLPLREKLIDRLRAESLVKVFATREQSQLFTGLPELVVEGLNASDARSLLASVIPGRLDERIVDAFLAETRGNPLALLELPRGLTAAQLAVGFALPGASSLSGRIEESFVKRLEALPGETQSGLLVAAAEPLGDPALLVRAAERLGIKGSAFDPAEAAVCYAVIVNNSTSDGRFMSAAEYRP